MVACSFQIEIYSLNFRALFRESNFGEDVLQYAEKAMVMSIAGFADKTWALRNTSAMMYSTLSSRVFGVKKTDDEQKISSSEFFSRFPVLQKALLENLGTAYFDTLTGRQMIIVSRRQMVSLTFYK